MSEPAQDRSCPVCGQLPTSRIDGPHITIDLAAMMPVIQMGRKFRELEREMRSEPHLIVWAERIDAIITDFELRK